MATTGTNGTSSNGSSPETDQDFDPSADMLIHDYDDEQTLEEEENISGMESVSAELNELEKESDMPIEHLLAMYGYSSQQSHNTSSSSSSTSMSPRSSHEHDTHSSSEEEILSNHDLTLDKEEIARDLLSNSDENEDEETDVHTLLNSVTSSQTARLLRSKSQPGSEGSDCEEDLDYMPQSHTEWKKAISVGAAFQSVVPEGLCKYGDAPAYENEDRLLWDPSKMDDSEVEKYLQEVHLQSLHSAVGVQSIPTGAHVRDDEQVLFLLLQCGHNKEEALRRRKMQVIPPTDSMSLWSEEECSNFEMGLHNHGKNFYEIHKENVKTRSVGEIAQFYYLWKKTERYDIFANRIRLEKGKYTLHPGITDYMERFLEDEEMPLHQVPARDRSASPVHSLLCGGPKRSHLKPHCEHGIGDGPQAFQPVLTNCNLNTGNPTVPCFDVKLSNSTDADNHFILKCPQVNEYVPEFKNSKLENVDNDSVPFGLNNSYADSSLDTQNHIDPLQVTSVSRLCGFNVNIHNGTTETLVGFTDVSMLESRNTEAATQ